MKLTFGKYAGKTLDEIYQSDPGYIEWLAEKAYQREVRDASRRFLADLQQQANDLKSAFIQMAKAGVYPGISGRVRYLDVVSDPGYAEITLGSMRNPMDMEDEDFFFSLTTTNPKEVRYEERETYEDDPRNVRYTIMNGNPTIARDEIPTLERPIWYACDGDKSFNEHPVTAADALRLLSENIV